jgi:chitodextrinase
VTGDTTRRANDVSSYGTTCGGGFTGGEHVFRITTRTDVTTVDFTLSDVVSSGPLSILALADTCDPASCVASSAGAETLSVPRGSAGQFYVVVDGAAGARGTFTLSATCR